MGHDDDPVAVFGPRPELPSRPPVPDDRIHGDTLPGPGESPLPAPGGPGFSSALLPRVRRRRRRRWVALGVGTAVVVAGLTVSRAVGSVEQQATLTHAVTGIRVNGAAGDVEVTGGAPAGTVELTRRVPRGSDTSSQAGQSWEGETLVIDSDPGWCGPLVFGCSINYTLRVPDGTTVGIDTGSGDLKLGGTLGAVNVKTGSGDIKAKRLQSTTLSAQAGSGDVDLGLTQAPTQLTVKTGSGDVDVEVPADGTYAVGVQTGSGDEKISVNRDSNSPRKVQIETGSGDVKFGYR